VQAGQSFGKLFGDESHRDKLLADLGAAALWLVSLPGKVLNAGRNAFLNLPNARSKFDQAAVKAHASLVKFQAQVTAPKGKRFVAPNIAMGPLATVKTGVINKNIVKVKLGPLPVKLDPLPGKKLDPLPGKK
jgi:hypothetical protein